MNKLKDYFIYFSSFLFTAINIFLFINSFLSNEFDKTKEELFRERFINLAGILFFGIGGFGIYFFKKYPHEDNRVKLFTILFGCLGFVMMSLAIIIYPESFKRGPKIIKYFFGFIGLIFFGFGLVFSAIKLIKYKK